MYATYTVTNKTSIFPRNVSCTHVTYQLQAPLFLANSYSSLTKGFAQSSCRASPLSECKQIISELFSSLNYLIIRLFISIFVYIFYIYLNLLLPGWLLKHSEHMFIRFSKCLSLFSIFMIYDVLKQHFQKYFCISLGFETYA